MTRYLVDPIDSQITFRTRHRFGTGPVTGTFAIRNGTITVTDPLERTTATLVVDSTGFASGNRHRDRHVTGPKFLDAERWPTIEARIGHLAGGLVQSAGEWTGQGWLTVKGDTQPLTVLVRDVSLTEDRLEATVEARVDRYAFGIRTAPGMAGRRLDLTVKVVAYPYPDEGPAAGLASP